MTKEEIIKQVTDIVREKGKIAPGELNKKLRWNDEELAEIGQLFGLAGSEAKFTKILGKIPNVCIDYNEYGTPTFVWLTEDAAEDAVAENAPEEDAAAEETPANVRERLKAILDWLTDGLYEKEEAVRLALLCAIAGENIFLLGPPGTAKSMISRRIRDAFGEKTPYFEYLMNEFSTPDEIFGAVKLKGLDEGVYEKNTTGYLPEAKIAFLDEIWKSGPAILNTLLNIINEKQFRNGNTIQQVPLQLLIAASNELPREKAGLEALYDRFTVRVPVEPISFNNEKAFFAMCEHGGDHKDISLPEGVTLLSAKEIKSWQKQINAVALDDKIKEVIQQIRKELQVKNQEQKREPKEQYYVSDRRWKKIVHVLKTAAFLCGRDAVDLMDCQLILYCIWNTPKQQQEVKAVVRDIVQQHGLESTTAIEEIKEQIEQFEDDVRNTFYNWAKETSHLEPVTKKDGNRIFYKVCENNQNIGYIAKSVVNDEYYARNYSRRLCRDKNFQNESTIDYYKDLNPETFIMKHMQYDSRDLRIETQTVIDQKAGWVKKNEIFNNTAAYKSTSNDFNKDNYQPIVKNIANEQKKLAEFRTENEKPYEENLFADPDFKDVILSKLDEEQKKLADAQVELDKVRRLYANG